MTALAFTVPGKPAPQGSKSYYRGRMVESSAALKPWRDKVAAHGRQAAGPGWQRLEGPVRVSVIFTFTRPASHYTRGKQPVLKPGAPALPVTEADTDKLSRAILDALTAAGIYLDDRQVTTLIAMKFYGEQPSCMIRVDPVAEHAAALEAIGLALALEAGPS
jgi:Holliday junction resolvase RusA-like endonuclease